MISSIRPCMSPSRFPNTDVFNYGQPQVNVPAPTTKVPVPQINVPAPTAQPIPPLVIRLPSPDSPIQ